jgi:hypothetical protein
MIATRLRYARSCRVAAAARLSPMWWMCDNAGRRVIHAGSAANLRVVPDRRIPAPRCGPTSPFRRLTTAHKELASHLKRIRGEAAVDVASRLGWNTRSGREQSRTAAFRSAFAHVHARAEHMTLRKPPSDQPNTSPHRPPCALWWPSRPFRRPTTAHEELAAAVDGVHFGLGCNMQNSRRQGSRRLGARGGACGEHRGRPRPEVARENE